MKIASVRGKTSRSILRDKGARMPDWALRREYRSTFRVDLSTEKVVEGALHRAAPRPGAGPPISVEEGSPATCGCIWATRSTGTCRGCRCGRRGQHPLGRVAADGAQLLRRLPGGRRSTGAPKTYLAALHAASPAQSARVQLAVVDAFPNVTAIDLALVVETLDGIFSKVAFAIQFMALFTVATGLVVLAGAVLMGRHQRIRETVLLRTLGRPAGRWR
jgi:putative ABC transport system permease protein